MMFAGTPGLTTTRSSWSNSQLGGSPGSNPTPASFNATASADHFSIGFWSLRATVAPRSTRNLAAAIPLRAAPIIKTFFPANSKTHLTPNPLPQLQCRQTQQRKQNREDQEAKDDLRLLPILHFKVMMQRRHLK